jgi:hypothetical protein
MVMEKAGLKWDMSAWGEGCGCWKRVPEYIHKDRLQGMGRLSVISLVSSHVKWAEGDSIYPKEYLCG